MAGEIDPFYQLIFFKTPKQEFSHLNNFFLEANIAEHCLINDHGVLMIHF